LEILGYVVPTPELYAKIAALAATPVKKRGYLRYAGFVSKIQHKKSVHGEYTVFSLSPSGSFWTRKECSRLKVGTFVSGTKSPFGNSTDFRIYKLTATE
jgi:hypothetical protein